MIRKALIVQGGWEGHEPKQVAEVVAEFLQSKGFETEISDTLDAFKDVEKLKSLTLIVPVWTMGKISGEQLNPVVAAVKSGVGIGGCHGGMCDSFREATEWQFMTGGQWVSHPGNAGVTYTVHITDPDHFITQGVRDFAVTSEQYYLHTDPANKVLATTEFPTPGADGPARHQWIGADASCLDEEVWRGTGLLPRQLGMSLLRCAKRIRIVYLHAASCGPQARKSWPENISSKQTDKKQVQANRICLHLSHIHADGGSRTHTGSPLMVFETTASAIPPHRLVACYYTPCEANLSTC